MKKGAEPHFFRGFFALCRPFRAGVGLGYPRGGSRRCGPLSAASPEGAVDRRFAQRDDLVRLANEVQDKGPGS